MRNINKLIPIVLVFICIISASTVSLAREVTREVTVDTNSNSDFEFTLNSQKQPLPPVIFSTVAAKGFAPFTIGFTDSTPDSTLRGPDFENGVKAGFSQMNAVFEYSASGDYTSELSVSNGNDVNSKFDKINIQGAAGDEGVLPEANFITNVTSGYTPLSVQFATLSKNTTKWKWDFGDGADSTEQNPVHTYKTPGTYTVNLTVSNVNGSDSKYAIISALNNSSQGLPVANFTTNVTNGSIPLSIKFSDSSTNAIAWKWNFGDGSSSTEQDPVHTYKSSGTYIVNLTVSNANGSDSKYANITALKKSTPRFPVANFITNVTNGTVPLSVQFADLSLNATQRSWDFGDGNISTIENPAHKYYKAGYYIASLTVSNENGTSIKTLGITVQEVAIYPEANFTVNVTSGYAPLSVQFTDTSKNATSNSWDFGDGTIYSNYTNNIYTYINPGTYNVTLTVSNANGTASKTQEIIVNESINEQPVLPVANFSVNATSGYVPLSVLFTDLSENATSIKWDFDSNGIVDSSEANPVYTYTVPEDYTVNFTVSNENGTSSKTTTITVLEENISSSDSKSSGVNSHSSSSGGGTGGSPELQSNVEAKELSQVFITNERLAEFDFPMQATSVVNITFNSKKTVGKTTTVVETLKNKSTLVSGLPAGEVYKFLNIWIGNSALSTSENIEDLTICFRVEKSWLQAKNINSLSITMQRFSDNKWNQLPTSFLKEDDNYLYFTARTPGFSSFAVTRNVKAEQVENKIQPATETKIQPVSETEIQPGAESKTEATQQNNNMSKAEQNSKMGNMGNIILLLVSGAILIIISLLIAFIYKKIKLRV